MLVYELKNDKILIFVGTAINSFQMKFQGLQKMFSLNSSAKSFSSQNFHTEGVVYVLSVYFVLPISVFLGV